MNPKLSVKKRINSTGLVISFIILFITPKTVSSKTDTLVTTYSKEFYDTINIIAANNAQSKQTFYLDIIKASLPAMIAFIATILTIIFTYKQTKKQLRHSESITLNKQRTEYIYNLIDMISKYLAFFDINNAETINKIKQGESISAEQLILENSLRILLNSDDDGGTEFVELVNRYRLKKVNGISGWIDELISISNKLITSKITKNEIKL